MRTAVFNVTQLHFNSGDTLAGFNGRRTGNGAQDGIVAGNLARALGSGHGRCSSASKVPPILPDWLIGKKLAGAGGMTSDAEHRRRSIRLKGYDYSQAGAYFITLCTHGHACLFGEITDGKMRLNDAGRMAQACWDAIPEHFPGVVTDGCVVMPNHIHGILWLDRGTACRAPTTCRAPTVEQFGKPVSGSLPTIIRSFKSAVTKRINESHGATGAPVWQRNYYEHIIRDDESLNQIRQYIIDNPAQWAIDRENQNRADHGD